MGCGNLYVHFPFCRSKCSYCALYSRPGVSSDERDAYARRIAEAIGSLDLDAPLDTVYFGGGTPALCDLRPVLAAIAPLLRPATGNASPAEFTVELHPLDVTPGLLDVLAAGGVNRISLGVQSLDDDILRHMGRSYTFMQAERAFSLVKERFDNAGIDLIVGYPGERAALLPQHERLASWGLSHCSVYSLQNERNLGDVPGDETVLDRLAETAEFLRRIGLERYEISNYAVPGFECRHNMAVWRGEDYIGLGDGACGRLGLVRTRNSWGPSLFHSGGLSAVSEKVTEAFDEKERRLFRLRTREGLDASGHPEWGPSLAGFAEAGLLKYKDVDTWVLTSRGMEVCDSILADLA